MRQPVPDRVPIAILGNGGAAVHTVRAMRESGYGGEIHLFSDHGLPAYNPMLLPYYLEGRISYERCFPFGEGFDVYADHRIHFHGGMAVSKLDAEQRTLTLRNGRTVAFGRAVVATGASAVLPPIPGIRHERVHGLRTLDDAARLRRTLFRVEERRRRRSSEGPPQAVVVGASVVGLGLVSLFWKRGWNVMLADLAEQVLPFAAYPEVAGEFAERLEKQGVVVGLGMTLTQVEPMEGGVRVHLAGTMGSGGAAESTGVATEVVEADVLAVAVGARPNMSFLDPRQIDLDVGVLVDEFQESSVPGIYAAGDVAQVPNRLTGGHEVAFRWADACRQGRTAGRNLAGRRDSYVGSPACTVAHVADRVLVSVGDPVVCRGEGALEVHRDVGAGAGQAHCYLPTGPGRGGANLLDCCSLAGPLAWALRKTRARGSFRAPGGSKESGNPWSLFCSQRLLAPGATAADLERLIQIEGSNG